MDERDTYLVRVWLPDRPGALGAVASRFGALKGDVIGLEIVERGGGTAIDELTVSLPSSVPIELIMKEVVADDDFEIEDIRRIDGSTFDPQLEALEAAAIILGADTRDDLAVALCEHIGRAVRLSWACVMERCGGVLGTWGDRPNNRWLDSFVSGTPPVGAREPGLELDTVWVPLPAASAALIVGRDSVLRARERQRLAAIARIADAWFARINERSERIALQFHPSGLGEY